MVCGQSFNLNTLPSKNQQCYENSPILWHEADEHVTCTLKSCLMPGLEVRATEELEEFPVGNVCMEKHGPQHFSCTTLRAQHELCITDRLSPVLVRVGAGMHRQAVRRGKRPFGIHRQALWEGWWAAARMVVTRHQLSSSPIAQPCSLAELPAPSTSPWDGKRRGDDEPLL